MSISDLIQFTQSRFGSDTPPADDQRGPGLIEADQQELSEESDELLADGPAIDRPEVPDWMPPTEDAPVELPEAPNQVVTTADRIGATGPPIVLVEGSILAPSEPFDGAGMYGATSQLPSIDALAFYLPFHFYGSRWGIYIKESGVIDVASVLLAGKGVATADEAVSLAAAVLLEHELFHFIAEVACSRGEVALLLKRYAPYFLDRRAAAHEEALANAHAFRAVRRRWPAARALLDAWMRSQGPGYRDYARWLSDRANREGCRLAAGPMLGRNPSRAVPADFLFDGIRSKRSIVPVRMVLDRGLLRIGRPFPKFDGMRIQVYSNDHPPPHVHIELPIGKPYTRYTWPDCEPYPGDLALTNSQRKKLDRYLDRHRAGIDTEVKKVYATSLASTS